MTHPKDLEPIDGYEMPDGVCTRQGFEEKVLRAVPSRREGFIFVHLQVNLHGADRRKYYQTMELDPENAILFANKLLAVAEMVEKKPTNTINEVTNGSGQGAREAS